MIDTAGVLLLVGEVTTFARIWYSLPLIIAIALVYGATRHERTKDIFVNAVRSMFWITGIGVVILGLILLTGYWN
ncbi:MAG: hypothetical protein R3C03_15230 [Pirellulaceae bacterium]